MSIKDKLTQGYEPPLQDKDTSPLSMMEEYQRLLSSMKGEDKVKINFTQNAGTFWGKIGKVRVTATKESEKGTKYYLVIADIIKNGEKLKLIQEWFIGQDGIAKVAPKKNITIPDDYADEIGMLISEEFEMEGE